MKFSTQQKSGVYLIPTSMPIPFLNRKGILLPLRTVAVSNAEPKSQDNFAFTGGSDEETYFEVKCLQLSDNDKKNAIFQKKYGVYNKEERKLLEISQNDNNELKEKGAISEEESVLPSFIIITSTLSNDGITNEERHFFRYFSIL